MVGEVFDPIVGQPTATAMLRAAVVAPVHAYLLVGPAGAGANALSSAFAAALLCPDGGCGACRSCRLALDGTHPDVHVFERQGASLSVADAQAVIAAASRSPMEGARKILVLTDFHLVTQAAPTLLKTIEEPPESTIFVILADLVTPELATIASRCVEVEVRPLPTALIASQLEAAGAEPDRAAAVAEAAAGDLDRAIRLLADDGLAGRRAAWASVPFRLDDTGATAVVIAEELLDLVARSGTALESIHVAERAALDERLAVSGERGGGRRQLEAAQRRQVRRHRTDELRAGLAVLASSYRDALADTDAHRARRAADAVDAIGAAAEALVRNPNEQLLLTALLLELPALAGEGRTDEGVR